MFEYFPPLLLACSLSLLGALAIGNVVAGNQHHCRPSPSVPLQRPAAGHEDRCAIPSVIDKLAFPSADTQQFVLDLVERQRRNVLPEFRPDPTHRFGALPAIQFLGTATPIGDHIVVEAAGDDGIMGQIEEARPLAQRRLRRLAL